MNPEMITALAALIAGVGGILSAILLHRKTTALLEYRMGQVERKLDSHNGYARMFSETSEQIARMQTDIEVIKTTLTFIQKEVDDGK